MSGQAVTADTPWREIGNTDFDSFQTALARTVKGPSPLVGEAESIYQDLYPLGLTRLAAVILWLEQKNATWYPDAEQYGMKRSFNNPYSVKNPTGGWARYRDDVSATKAWAALILGPAFQGTKTTRDFIARYAPPSENDTAAYIRNVVTQVNALPRVDDAPSPTPTPPPDPTPLPTPQPPRVPTPIIYDLGNAADAARFGMDASEVRYLRSRCFSGRDGRRPAYIVLHIQDGITSGSLDWWVHGVDGGGARIQASSTVTVQKDGSVLRVIPETDGPWTNGDVQGPDARGTRLVNLGDNPNVWTLSIEAEGWHGGILPPSQRDSIVWQVDQWQRRYDIPTGNVLGHYDINSVTRNQCGRYIDQIVPLLTYGGTTQPPVVVYPKPGPTPDWTGYDAMIGTTQAYALDRVFVAAENGVRCHQYATRQANDVRQPLAKGETVWAAWLCQSEGEWWIISKFGSRIPASGLSPVVSVSGTPVNGS